MAATRARCEEWSVALVSKSRTNSPASICGSDRLKDHKSLETWLIGEMNTSQTARPGPSHECPSGGPRSARFGTHRRVFGKSSESRTSCSACQMFCGAPFLVAARNRLIIGSLGLARAHDAKAMAQRCSLKRKPLTSTSSEARQPGEYKMPIKIYQGSSTTRCPSGAFPT